MAGRCPRCHVDLDDDGTRVWCWRCGWEVRDVDDPHGYGDLSDEVRYRETGSYARNQQVSEAGR